MFDIFKKFSLSHLGDDWKDCYLTFRPISLEESVEFSRADTKDKELAGTKTIDILKEKFVEGKAMSDGKMVDVTPDTLVKFPADVLLKVVEFVSGIDILTDKKKSNGLETSTEVSEVIPPKS